jgi:hypothetical protein
MRVRVCVSMMRHSVFDHVSDDVILPLVVHSDRSTQSAHAAPTRSSGVNRVPTSDAYGASWVPRFASFSFQRHVRKQTRANLHTYLHLQTPDGGPSPRVLDSAIIGLYSGSTSQLEFVEAEAVTKVVEQYVASPPSVNSDLFLLCSLVRPLCCARSDSLAQPHYHL